MACPYHNICGGCLYRNLSMPDYQSRKEQNFKKILSGLIQPDVKFGTPVFIGDNVRPAGFNGLFFSQRKFAAGL